VRYLRSATYQHVRSKRCDGCGVVVARAQRAAASFKLARRERRLKARAGTLKRALQLPPRFLSPTASDAVGRDRRIHDVQLAWADEMKVFDQ